MNQKHNKQEIIEKGRELVRRNGFTNTGVNMILQEMNIPKGSFYNYFPTKEIFGQEILRNYGEIRQNATRHMLSDQSISPMVRLERMYNAMIAFMESEGFSSGCLINNLSVELGGLNAQIAAVADEEFLANVSIIAACIREGQELQEIRDDLSASALAEFIHSSFIGAMFRMKASRSRAPLDLSLGMILKFLKN